jgi:hypothetical protein
VVDKFLENAAFSKNREAVDHFERVQVKRMGLVL